MARLEGTRLILAVRSLRTATDFYVNALGFKRDFGDESDGWSWLSRDNFRVGLGECKDANLELVSPVLTRALEPFPKPVRTLDALHLASAEYLRERQPAIRLATYDSRQATAAKAMGIALYDLDGT
jgi:catechol 2,3-dioxygenase-like lactoylglutathione lyase family enzyme